MEYRITDQTDIHSEYEAIQYGLNILNDEKLGHERKPLNIFCYENEKFIGGIVGGTIVPCLSIRWLWVDAAYRNNGVGRTLINEFEKVGREKGCDRVFVDTLSYQAPKFYQKQGYTETARIIEFHPGYDRVFYRKDLV